MTSYDEIPFMKSLPGGFTNLTCAVCGAINAGRTYQGARRHHDEHIAAAHGIGPLA